MCHSEENRLRKPLATQAEHIRNRKKTASDTKPPVFLMPEINCTTSRVHAPADLCRPLCDRVWRVSIPCLLCDTFTDIHSPLCCSGPTSRRLGRCAGHARSPSHRASGHVPGPQHRNSPTATLPPALWTILGGCQRPLWKGSFFAKWAAELIGIPLYV